MIEFTRYAGTFEGYRGYFTKLPQWARFIVGIFAIPGLILAFLSILMLLVSILALLLLTLPVYTLLKRITSGPVGEPTATTIPTDAFGTTTPGVKRVESTIVE
jgi:hypothetical protein